METSSRRKIENVVEKLVSLAEEKRKECDGEYSKHLLWLRKAFQDNTNLFINQNAQQQSQANKKYNSMRPSVLTKIKKSLSSSNELSSTSNSNKKSSNKSRKRKSDEVKLSATAKPIEQKHLSANKSTTDSPAKKRVREQQQKQNEQVEEEEIKTIEQHKKECWQLTVKILKIQLKGVGLSTSGKKAVLVSRLAQYRLEQQQVQQVEEEEMKVEEIDQQEEQVEEEDKQETAPKVEKCAQPEIDKTEEENEVKPQETTETNNETKDIEPEETAATSQSVRLEAKQEETPHEPVKQGTVPQPTAQAETPSDKANNEVTEENTKSDEPPKSELEKPIAEASEPKEPVVVKAVLPERSENVPSTQSVVSAKPKAVVQTEEKKTGSSLEELRMRNKMKLQALKSSKKNLESTNNPTPQNVEQPKHTSKAPEVFTFDNPKAADNSKPQLSSNVPANKIPDITNNNIQDQNQSCKNNANTHVSQIEKPKESEPLQETKVASSSASKAEDKKSMEDIRQEELRREMNDRLERERRKSLSEAKSKQQAVSETSNSTTSTEAKAVPEDKPKLNKTGVLGNIVKGISSFTDQVKPPKEAPKPKKVGTISALEKARLAREAQEKKEEERRKQRELHRQRVAENKRRKEAEKANRVLGTTANRTTSKSVDNGSKPKVAPPAPENAWDPADNYVISDKGESSSDSSDDSDDESNKLRKRIPRWARGEEFRNSLRRQYDPRNKVDPDEIFGEIQDCDLEAIFKPRDSKRKQKYKIRGSSAMWHKDGLTLKEAKEYKREIGLE